MSEGTSADEGGQGSSGEETGNPAVEEETETPAVEVEDVEKSYGEVRALKGVSLAVERGTIHGLVGPNGSGKTTLFRLLLGLAKPDSGSVSMVAPPGCGFQHPQCYRDLTVGENLDVFASLAGAPRERVADLEDQLGLARARDRLARDLSGGTAKKLDLALAFLDRPEIVLLDEPFADVDDGSKADLLDFFEAYADDGRTLVITTHQLEAFEDLLDAITVLHRGEVVARERRGALEGRSFREVYRDAIGDR